MSSFNQILNNKNQFIIAIKVIKCPTEEQYKDGNAVKLMKKAKSRRALIDTGASNTCISQDFADELGLISVGNAIMGTAGNPCQVNKYKVDFAIPVENTKLTPIKEKSKENEKLILIDVEHWVHAQHKILSIPSINQDRGFDFIIGMDILSKMHITIFNRQVIMSF